MQSMPAGSMLAVMHGSTAIEELISNEPGLDLAVVNSHAVAVVAGTDSVIEKFAGRLESQGIDLRTLKTSHAFHSAMMEPMLDEFTQVVTQATLSPPKIPYMSNVTGTWITDQEALNPEYYASQIRSTVRFADNLANLVDDDQDDLLLIEMGPGGTLTRLAQTQLASSNHVAISTIPNAKDRDVDSHRLRESRWEMPGRLGSSLSGARSNLKPRASVGFHCLPIGLTNKPIRLNQNSLVRRIRIRASSVGITSQLGNKRTLINIELNKSNPGSGWC